MERNKYFKHVNSRVLSKEVGGKGKKEGGRQGGKTSCSQKVSAEYGEYLSAAALCSNTPFGARLTSLSCTTKNTEMCESQSSSLPLV